MQVGGRGSGPSGQRRQTAVFRAARVLGVVGLLIVAFGVDVVRAGPPPDNDLALLGMPSNMTVTATRLGGAVVTYTLPTNGDGDDSDGVVACTPNTGSVFPIGTTTVTCTLTDPNDDLNNPVSATFTVTVQPGLPATLTLSPGNTSVGLFTPATETATVEDQFGNPVADGTMVSFSVTGANTASGGRTTTNGKASFTYADSAAFPGVDTLTAKVSVGSNPSATAVITWTLPASTSYASLSLFNLTNPEVFGAVITVSGGPGGVLDWQSMAENFLTFHVTALTVSGPQATLFGVATLDSGQTVEFRVDAMAGANLVGLQLSNGYNSGMLHLQRVRVTP
ncbi:MAG TPA: HYR domain-containing protein [Thermomicrobiaceae bacterium]|nr:HYR domain-containing protein [Thermomicrobiaceae bacterium]